MSPQVTFGWIMVGSAILAGCAERVPNTTAASSEKTPGSLTTAKADATSGDAQAAQTIKNVQLVEADWTGLQELVAEHKGKIVVVDVWSTACEPCMKEFPHLIALHQQHPDDVVAVSFDVDYAGMKNKPVSYYRERVLKFLGSQAENNVLHRMSNIPADEVFTELKLDSIPTVYVYGRDGMVAKRFDGSNSQGAEVSYEKQIIPFVEDLFR